MKQFAKILVHALFWSWNAIFLVFVTLGFAPIVGLQLFDGVRVGLIPWEFLAYGLTIIGVPIFSVIVGAVFLRRSPSKLLALGYGVQAPLMIGLTIRFFAVREMMPGVALLMVVAGFGLATLMWQLLDTKIDTRGLPLSLLRVAGLTALLLLGVYACVWVAFYVLPVGAAVIEMVSQTLRELPRILVGGSRPPLTAIPFMLLGTLLMAYSATLFVALPIATPIIYARHWWLATRSLFTRFSRPLAIALPAVVVAVCAAGFLLTNQQPQREVFTLLDKPPASVAEANTLVQQQDTIRSGLLNAYLASYRYMSAAGEVQHISDLYRNTLHTTRAQALEIEKSYEGVISPFLYQPAQPITPPPTEADRRNQTPGFNQSFRTDAERAADLYQRVFDQPINKAERDTIMRAVRSTWNRDLATNAWQAVDDREILMTRQELNVSEHGDWADVELYEAYRNDTTQRQEVVYYFNLPESAVLTGVWLGNSTDREQRYAFRVAPRGAAQTLYRNEVRRNIDPALVEQIGPRQYRLRVFPIEPPTWRWDSSSGRSYVEEAPQMHLWLTWRTMASGSAWVMPRLAEKRNVYWDGSSARLVNGQPVKADDELWLPESVPAAQMPEPVAHRVDFDNGTTIIAEPAGNAADAMQQVASMRLAVVVDRSYSMAAHAGEVQAALDELRGLGLSAPADAYLTASPYRGEEPSVVELSAVTPEQLTYYGGQNPAQLLRQFARLRTGRAYDAVLVLTDDGGYELGGATGISLSMSLDAPVWMVHLGNTVPLGYDDNTLQAIQASGGGVAANLDEALVRIGTAASQQRQAAQGLADVVDGYVWRAVPTSDASAFTIAGMQTHAADEPFAALAARRLILAEVQHQRAALNEVGTLDQLHAIATRQGIVTPYSSMIVLVNDDQKRRLEQLEKNGNRFEREQEQIGETMPEGAPVVTGVPEPEEWLLIALAAGMLGWLAWRRRRMALAAVVRGR